MKIEIYARPMFAVPFSKKQVEILMKLSEMHYDHECRISSKLGGFLYGLNNFLQSFEHCDQMQPYTCSFRDLDILLKIMEGRMLLADRDESITILALSTNLYGAMTMANRESAKWTVSYEVRD